MIPTLDSKKNRAVFDLILAGIIWGSSFTAVKWCLGAFSTYSLLMSRFVIASILGLVGYAILNFPELKRIWRAELLNSISVGLFLGLTLWLQTYGLNFTTATKSSFITSLYVVLIPILLQIFYRSRVVGPLGLGSYATAIMALFGMYLLIDPRGGEVNKGDLITLGCTIAASFHIIYTSWKSKASKSPFLFNIFQNFWCFVFILPFFIFEKDPFRIQHLDLKIFFGFLILCIGCTLIGFFLQVRAQRVLSTQVSSMLCLLEGPFASLFAFTLGAERLSYIQLLGAAVILGSSYLAVYLEPAEKTAATNQ